MMRKTSVRCEKGTSRIEDPCLRANAFVSFPQPGTFSLFFATPSNSHKGGFYNCEGLERHAITKDKSLSPLKFFFFFSSYPPRSIPPVYVATLTFTHTRENVRGL